MALEIGTVYEGTVTGITKFGAFVSLPEGKSGMVHISEVADVYVNEIRDFVSEGQTVKVKVISIGNDGKISLSMKKAVERAPQPRRDKPFNRQNSAPQKPRPEKKPQYPVFTGNPDLDWTPTKSGNAAFEDMMQKYKQSSEEKMSDMKKAGFQKRGSSRQIGRAHV